MSTRIRNAAKAVTSARVRAASRPRGLWVEVEPGFHVGNDRRQFLGSITGTPLEGFRAFGPQSDFLGQFDDLDVAKAAVATAASGAVAAPEAEPQLG
ncbi:hypothetical protein JOF42_000824 [Microbacterium phyllosphaerae]|uniref:Uncharacterized protein n=1 Tax=Microbacterium phyllosphaerae TaxID=124798 RepID=A0ABS4WM92_9MICO|nr:hypothetical protein [Microbacterium phyllosphaerae]MBP2377329.1 hypothetical protein [Microbacterium phyllosphaerae]